MVFGRYVFLLPSYFTPFCLVIAVSLKSILQIDDAPGHEEVTLTRKFGDEKCVTSQTHSIIHILPSFFKKKKEF